MRENRLFTEQQLKDMGALTRDRIEQAIDTGDYETAKKRLRRMHDEFLTMHDVYVDWVAALLTFIGTRYGDEVLYEALNLSMESWLRPSLERWDVDAGRRLRLMVSIIHGHLKPCSIEEDEEKFIITWDCGSGGELIARGRYGPPTNFLRVKRAHVMTRGREDFPVYCAHCAIHEILPIELGMEPWLVIMPPKEVGKEPCRFYLYKDPKAIPHWVYRRVGKDKADITKDK